MTTKKCRWCEDPSPSGDFCDELCEKLWNARGQKEFDIRQNPPPAREKTQLRLIRGRRR